MDSECLVVVRVGCSGTCVVVGVCACVCVCVFSGYLAVVRVGRVVGV